MSQIQPPDAMVNPSLPGAAGEPTVHHVGARTRRGRPVTRMQLNLTPMIDVIFQLLIYFIITANFMVDEGVLTAKLPQGTGMPSPAQIAPPTTPLEIVLRPVGGSGVSITVAGAPPVAGFRELTEALASLQYDPRHGRPDGVYEPDNPVLIRPTPEVRWQHVVNAFNAAIAARYGNVRFAQVEASGQAAE